MPGRQLADLRTLSLPCPLLSPLSYPYLLLQTCNDPVRRRRSLVVGNPVLVWFSSRCSADWDFLRVC